MTIDYVIYSCRELVCLHTNHERGRGERILGKMEGCEPQSTSASDRFSHSLPREINHVACRSGRSWRELRKIQDGKCRVESSMLSPLYVCFGSDRQQEMGSGGSNDEEEKKEKRDTKVTIITETGQRE